MPVEIKENRNRGWVCYNCGESYESPSIKICVMCGGNLLEQSELDFGFQNVPVEEPNAENTLKQKGYSEMKDTRKELEKECREIKDEIERIAIGEIWYCGECGTKEYPSEHLPQNCDCGAYLEQSHMRDYFDEILDAEYTIAANGELKSGKMYLTLNSPKIWVDTATREVVGHWGEERFEVHLSQDAVADIYEILKAKYTDLVSNLKMKGV